MLEQIYPWQQEDYANLIKLEHKLPHAMILYGSPNMGLKNLATSFINHILCQDKNSVTACSKCNSCILLAENNHPDFYILENKDEDKKQISVDSIRAMLEFVSTAPHLGQKKIIIIEDSDKLNISSSNALLKILEEPPAYAFFILLTKNLGRILPTLKSRSFKYHIKNPELNQALDYFKQQANTTNAQFWLKFYDHCPLFTPPISEQELEQITKTLLTPSIDNIYAASTDFDGKKVDFLFILQFLNKWLYDLVNLKLCGKLEYFALYQDKIQKILEKMVVKKAYYLRDQINFLENYATHPLNYKLQIENLLLRYQQIFVV